MENGNFGGGGNNPNNNNNNQNGGNNNRGGGGPRNNRNGQMVMVFVLITLVALLFMSLVSKWQTQMTAQEISYTEFLKMVEDGKVESVDLGSQQIDITPKPDKNEIIPVTYYTGYVGDQDLVSTLKEAGVEIKGEIPDNTAGWIYNIVSFLLPIVILWVLLGFLMKRMGGGAMGVGKNTAKVYVEKKTGVTFKDVAGQDEAKESLQEVVDFLHNPRKYTQIGAKLPKGALLVGPPGTGKTLLAKAVAGEAGVPFFSLAGSDFVEMFVGVGASRVRDLFKEAQKQAPCIIFIDEIDAIGKKRTGGEYSDTTESMLNALLTEMDGFSATEMAKPVFVLAATNYGVGAEQDGIAALDDALIRRFDNKIYVDLPKESERKKYLMRMLEKKGITTVSEETAQNIAERTTGQSLAILQNVLDLACRNAVREQRKVSDRDLLTALEEYIYGEKKEHTPEYYQSVAIHETGHAYMSYISGDKPSYITIESRGDFGGYMQHANQEDVTGYTREEILAKIRTSLAGRAAEEVFYGREKSLNTGASSDLKQATNLAFGMLCTYGMEEQQLAVLPRQEILRSSLAADYVARVNDILNTEMKKTVEIIREAKDTIQAIADVLVKENRLTGEQFDKLMQERRAV